MYADPKHIRDREVKVRLDDVSFDLLEAMATFSRRQRAVLARELIEQGLKALFAEAASQQEAQG
mgnify:FL=1